MELSPEEKQWVKKNNFQQTLDKLGQSAKNYGKDVVSSYYPVISKLIREATLGTVDFEKNLPLPESFDTGNPNVNLINKVGDPVGSIVGSLVGAGKIAKPIGKLAETISQTPIVKEAITRAGTALGAGGGYNIGAVTRGEKTAKEGAIDTLTGTASTVLGQGAERLIPKGVFNFVGQLASDIGLDMGGDLATGRLPKSPDQWPSYLAQKGIQNAPGVYFASKGNFDALSKAQNNIKPTPETTEINTEPTKYLQEIAQKVPEPIQVKKQEPKLSDDSLYNVARLYGESRYEPGTIKHGDIIKEAEKIKSDPVRLKSIFDKMSGPNHILESASEGVAVQMKGLEDWAKTGSIDNAIKAWQDINTIGSRRGVELEAQKIDLAKKAFLENPKLSSPERLAGKKVFDDILNKMDEAKVKLTEFNNKAKELGLSKTEDWSNPNNQEKITTLYRTFIKPKFREWGEDYIFFNLLSSPKTLLTVNNFSNLYGSTVAETSEKFLSGLVDAIGSKISGKPQTQFSGEAGAYLKTLLEKRNLKTAGQKAGQIMTGRVLSDLSTENNITQNIPKTTQGQALRPLENVLKTPGRILQAGDALMTGAGKPAQIQALEYRKQKLEQQPKSEGRDKALAKLNSDIEGMAGQSAKEATLNEPLDIAGQGPVRTLISKLSETISAGRQSKNPLGRFLMARFFPFIKIPTNATKRGLDYGPAGLGNASFAKNKEFRNKLIARGIIGSAITGAVFGLVKDSDIHTGLSTNEEERKLQRQAGVQPWSIDIPAGGDKKVNIQFQYLPPQLAYPLGTAAIIKQAFNDKRITENKAEVLLSAVIDAAVYPLKASTLKQVDDFVSLFTGEGIVGKAGKTLSNLVGQFAPARGFAGWIGKVTDELYRNPVVQGGDMAAFQTMVNNVMRYYPGVAQKLPAEATIEPSTKTEPAEVIKTTSPLKERLFNAISPANITIPTTQRVEARRLLNYKTDIKRINTLISDLNKTMISKDFNKNPVRAENQIIRMAEGIINKTGALSDKTKDYMSNWLERETPKIIDRMTLQDENESFGGGVELSREQLQEYNMRKKKEIVRGYLESLRAEITKYKHDLTTSAGRTKIREGE